MTLYNTTLLFITLYWVTGTAIYILTGMFLGNHRDNYLPVVLCWPLSVGLLSIDICRKKVRVMK